MQHRSSKRMTVIVGGVGLVALASMTRIADAADPQPNPLQPVCDVTKQVGVDVCTALPTPSLPPVTVPDLPVPGGLPVPTDLPLPDGLPIPPLTVPSLPGGLPGGLPAVTLPTLPNLSLPPLNVPPLTLPKLPVELPIGGSTPTTPTVTLPTLPAITLPTLPGSGGGTSVEVTGAARTSTGSGSGSASSCGAVAASSSPAGAKATGTTGTGSSEDGGVGLEEVGLVALVLATVRKALPGVLGAVTSLFH